VRILYFTIRGLFFVDSLSWFLDVVEGKLLIKKNFSASLSFLLRSLRFELF
jgi:hypothetical protein